MNQSRYHLISAKCKNAQGNTVGKPVGIPARRLMKEVKIFLKAQKITVRRSKETEKYSLIRSVVPRLLMADLDANDVVGYAVKLGFVPTGQDPTPSNIRPFVLPRFEDYKSEGCTIYNVDFRKIVRVDGSLAITDPPYDIGYKYDIHEDHLGDEKWLDMMDGIQKPCVIILPWKKTFLLAKIGRAHV